MKRTISAQLDASPDRVFEVLADLGTYVNWLDLVTRSEPATPVAADTGPAWVVTLRAKVGPLARSKRLRMVRTHTRRPDTVLFERAEVDDRDHSSWLLNVDIAGAGPCDVQVDLTYQGTLWTAPLGAILRAQADDAVPRLQALVAD
ncbi:MAG: SRPBCC family protein [Acidimicrobiales bacterium]